LASPVTTSLPEDPDWNPAAELAVAAETAAVLNEPAESLPLATASLVKTELKALARQSSHYMVGLIGNLCLGLISFPIFTRVLSVSEYGIMDLGQRLLLMLTISSKLGFQNATLRFYNRKEFSQNPAAARSFYSTIFFGMLATALTAGVLFLVTAGMIPRAVMLGPLANLIYHFGFGATPGTGLNSLGFPTHRRTNKNLQCASGYAQGHNACSRVRSLPSHWPFCAGILRRGSGR